MPLGHLVALIEDLRPYPGPAAPRIFAVDGVGDEWFEPLCQVELELVARFVPEAANCVANHILDSVAELFGHALPLQDRRLDVAGTTRVAGGQPFLVDRIGDFGEDLPSVGQGTKRVAVESVRDQSGHQVPPEHGDA